VLSDRNFAKRGSDKTVRTPGKKKWFRLLEVPKGRALVKATTDLAKMQKKKKSKKNKCGGDGKSRA